MSAGARRNAASTHKQRALAATGLMATIAGGGFVAANAAEAQAATGKIHACYNKSTHALKYTKKASCAKGSKLVTWNKQGPQGAAGAKGAQGPQGAAGVVNAGADERYDSQSITVGPDSSAVVASYTPASGGYFDVNGFANVSTTSGSFVCFVRGGTLTNNSTPQGDDFAIPFPREMAVPTTGIVLGGPTLPLQEFCRNYNATHSGKVAGAVVNAIHVTNAHVTFAHKAQNKFNQRAGKFRAGSPRNTFKKR